MRLPDAEQTKPLVAGKSHSPKSFSEQEVVDLLAREGYTRVHCKRGRVLEVVQDRLRLSPERRERIVEALESALTVGRGWVSVHPLDGLALRFSAELYCRDCDSHYREPVPNLKD